MQLKPTRTLTAVGALLLVSTGTYLCLKSPSTSFGQGYISPTTILPNYISSLGLDRCDDVHLIEDMEQDDTGKSERVSKEILVEYMQDHITRKQQDFDAQADKDYLGINIGPTWDLPAYRAELLETYHMYLFTETSKLDYIDLVKARISLRSATSVFPKRPKQILTSNKDKDLPWSFRRWRSLHRGWNVRLFDDDALDAWVGDNFGGTRAEEVWRLLPLPVLKTDIFRYMALLLEGGIYTDSDTAPVIPADKWGIPYQNASDPLLSHFSRILALPTVSPSGEESVAQKASLEDGDASDPPSLVISIESDAIDFGWYNWREVGLIRALQIVQWTIMARPGHPVFLDAIGRTLRKTEEFARLNKEAKEREESFTPETALEWTGPGIFTDCVYRYLLTRYGVHPRELLHLKDPLRIGDVLILPAGSYHSVSPWDPRETWRPYAAVWHGFWGRWRETDSSELQKGLLNKTKEAQQQE
ncbi:hypothetical protein QFC21_003525 [Naganishia friedmannii]|uniref:Uncharacterized protein n=1 Tax=Naganishia friedmannii TaxID=89922 RepID=A0ACC2VNY5_9TREE|nr:hypothetical protein QFC21_003525 [Naganishia friedmannii]